MVKLTAEGDISDYIKDDSLNVNVRLEESDSLKNIPHITLEKWGIERPTLYQRMHTYAAMKIVPIYLNLLHRLKREDKIRKIYSKPELKRNDKLEMNVKTLIDYLAVKYPLPKNFVQELQRLYSCEPEEVKEELEHIMEIPKFYESQER